MIYFCRGSLPWQGIKASTDDERNKRIKEKKINTPTEDLCHGLPDAFASYFNYVQTLGFDEQPDYSYLRKLFRDLFVREGFEYDHVFDWTVKKFNMIYGNVDQPVVLKARSSKRGNNHQRNLTDKPSASPSLKRPLCKRVSESAKVGRSPTFSRPFHACAWILVHGSKFHLKTCVSAFRDSTSLISLFLKGCWPGGKGGVLP